MSQRETGRQIFALMKPNNLISSLKQLHVEATVFDLHLRSTHVGLSHLVNLAELELNTRTRPLIM